MFDMCYKCYKLFDMHEWELPFDWILSSMHCALCHLHNNGYDLCNLHRWLPCNFYKDLYLFKWFLSFIDWSLRCLYKWVCNLQQCSYMLDL